MSRTNFTIWECIKNGVILTHIITNFEVSPCDNKSASHWIMFDYFFHGSNPVEGRTKNWQLKDLILTLFGLIVRRIYNTGIHMYILEAYPW